MAAEVALAVIGLGAPGTGAMPSPLWRGADRLILSCTADAAGTAALGADWCAIALAEARRGAPLAIAPATREPGGRSALTLDIAATGGEFRITIARALAVDESEGAFFRRGPSLPATGLTDARVQALLAAALDGALPWRRSSGPGALRSRRPAT